MAKAPLRLLIKAHPSATRGEVAFGARAATLQLKPLFTSIERPKRAELGVAAPPVWHLASVELDEANPWDLCHQLMERGLGVAGRAEVAFAEPDLEQSWLWASEQRQVLGLTSECGAPAPQDNDVYAVRPDNFWFRQDGFSQLEAAREAVGQPPAASRVRIAHLDTGYDPNHSTKPAHLRLDLQHNFADDGNPDDATDRPTAVVNPMHGHGTGTLGLLAGNTFQGKALGGAPYLDVVPVRVANWVVLFSNSAIARAFDYVHGLWDDPTTRVHVISMSMGGIASAAWADAVNALYDRGVVVVTAAGNCFGNLPTRYCVYPARFRRVLAACGVMANDRPYADLPIRKMAGCYGPRRKQATSLAAYTPNVPWPMFGCQDLVDFDGGGTSAATPQIAAAAALWIQQHKAACDAYPQGWMRVEAVRKALFDSATNSDAEHYGRGILRANDALAMQPAQAGALQPQDEDSASFALLRVLTGLGVAAVPPDRQRMLELEALQISQRSEEIERLLDGLDPSDPEVVGSANARRVIEALAEHPSASAALKGEIARWRDRVTPPRPGEAAPAPPAEKRKRKAAPLPPSAIVPEIAPPPARRLRVFAFDPLLGTRLETLAINEGTISVPWEADLQAGPVGEYLEVVDIDPPSGHAYAPVDLNRTEILAQQGLAPSEGNPQFHQQMAYAVIMKTIGHFERALGRVALWAERRVEVDGKWESRFVRRLRVYPHALREANAYYSPDKKALLLGYFTASKEEAGDNLPGGLVFTCLSHDIVAHETTHALLDGLHPRFTEQTSIDNLAFHEAFADIVALFQHFTLPEALRHQIAQSRGDLALARLLGGLAMQFGQAIGERGALRSALGRVNEETGEWEPHKPSQSDYEAAQEPHDRGAVLVAAVFDAFLQIYGHRTADLVRLATGGSGVLPPGRIPHDLVERLAQEAAKVAGQVLNICIRALDYCPPVDLTFGEYLRALITADFDVVPDDDRSYRVAFVSAFRARGIFPSGVRTLSVDSLTWQKPEIALPGLAETFDEMTLTWDVHCDRFEAYTESKVNAAKLHGYLLKHLDERHFAVLGLFKTREPRHVTIDGEPGEVSRIEVHSVRPARRASPDGEIHTDVVIEITQSWYPDEFGGEFFRAGCTIICDAESGAIRYVVRKRIGNKGRIDATRDFRLGVVEGSLAGNYFSRDVRDAEPFALLHRGA